MTLDDHEVDDDWRWLDENRRKPYIPVWVTFQRKFCYKRPRSEGKLMIKRVRAALQAYWEHQGMHAPPAIRTLEIDQKGRYMLQKEDPGSFAYEFEYGAAAFFVLDTRTMRVRARLWKELIWRNERTMLGEEQWKDLEAWLLKVKDQYPVKFLISSCSMLYYSRFDLPRDRWSGFKKERERLLELIAEHEIEGLYILSGDVHIGHAIHAEVKSPSDRLFPLWEFCSSPFEQEAMQIMRRTRKEIDSEFLVRQDLKFDIDAHNFGVVGVSMEDPAKPEVTYRLYYDDMHIGIDTKV